MDVGKNISRNLLENKSNYIFIKYISGIASVIHELN